MIYAENILICIAAPLVLILPFVGGTVRRFLAAFLTGMLMCLLAAYIGGAIRAGTGMAWEETAIFVSPIVEETMKFLPLLLTILLFDASADGMFRTAIALGAGFVTLENCCYLLGTGAERLSYMLVRGAAAGVMHIVSVLALSMGLTLAGRFGMASFPGFAGSLATAMMIHALYNLLVSAPGVPSVIGYIMPLTIAILLYLPYRSLRKDVLN